MTRTPAAQRVLDAALELFAQRGFAATTIADIETASGLTRGAGGIYRHFGSKFELLEQGLRDHLDGLDRMHAIPVDGVGLDVRQLLMLYARTGLVMIRSQRSIIRLLFRDLDQFPELLDEVKRRLVNVGTAEFATRLRHLVKTHRLDAGHDVEALAAIFIGAVTNLGVLEATLDEPAIVDDERFVTTWVAALATMLESKADA
jgi:AcrR family transcriptional regulator